MGGRSNKRSGNHKMLWLREKIPLDVVLVRMDDTQYVVVVTGIPQDVVIISDYEPTTY